MGRSPARPRLTSVTSEAELHVLRARLQGGIHNKAWRGEFESRSHRRMRPEDSVFGGGPVDPFGPGGELEEGAYPDDEFSLGEDDKHPLQEKAQELALRAMDLVQREAGPGTPAYRSTGGEVTAVGAQGW